MGGLQICIRRFYTSGFLCYFVAKVAAEGKIRKYVVKKGPEARLCLALVAGFLLPVGMLIYAWTARPSIHWIAPLVGLTVSFSRGPVLTSYLYSRR